MNNRRNVSLFLFFALFIAVCAVLKPFGESSVLQQIAGALLSAVITVIITSLLLNRQTEKHIEHDCQVEIFKSKQKLYLEFIKELNSLASEYENVANEEKKKIMHQMTYWLGSLQMHMCQQNYDALAKKVCNIFGTYTTDHKKDYKNIARNLLEATKLLGKDLYNNGKVFSASRMPYNLAITISGIFDKNLRTKEKRNELHIIWWELFLNGLAQKSKIIKKLTKSNIEQKVKYYEEEKDAQFDFIIAETKNLKFFFYISFNHNEPICFGFETSDKNQNDRYINCEPKGYQHDGFGNPGVCAKHIDEKFDIDFYDTNMNYYAFACMSIEERRKMIAPLAKEVSNDISEFLTKIKLKNLFTRFSIKWRNT